MQCGTCGAENRPGRRFCGQCGGALEIACPVCGAANDPGDRFCGSCGTGLAEGAAAPAPTSRAAAQRRLVSVLFADLVGFTTLSEHRDPEEVRDLLSRYFDRCRGLIEGYGGVVEKFIGDAVMAVWGTPVAREDDAERAVRAALALTQAVSALAEEVAMPGLAVRAGVLTGPAAVDLAAEGEGMVLGDTVNTAARLQSIAAPGTVLVDDVTRRASEAAIVYEDTGTHRVKGREEPVRGWTALRVVAGVGGARRSSGLEPPFVGRDAALAEIVAACDAAVAESAARRVTVVGEAGAGKSRLLWEFFKHIDGLQANFWWHQGRALSYGEGVGYWALAEMVRTRAGILEEEEPGAARAKLGALVERYVPDDRERRLVEPRLAHLLGLEQRTASDRADLFSGWRLFFERLAATSPVILAFEDLQWADPSLLDFVDYLLEWSAEFPIFVLALARPELAAARPAWQPEVVLEPLPDPAMRALLEGLVPGLPAELAQRILVQAEGVPLYAVETVRMLLDRGLLAQEGARYVVTGEVGHLAVPETLHALVAARLDGLEPDERTLLQLASVFGQAFPPAVVGALSGRTVDDVRARLDGLVVKQVLGFDDDPRSADRGQYRFLQGLLRTIAYGTLSRRDRKAAHLAAARHLQETADAGELADVLASHFLEAARADPDAPDASKIRAAARETLAEAGRRALSLALGREAQRAFDQAAELAEDEEARADLLEQAGRAAWLEADGAAARERLDAAVALHEAAGRMHAAARTTLAIADVQWPTGSLDTAIATTERAYRGLVEDDADRAAAAALLGKLRGFRIESEAALTATEQALRIAEPLQAWAIVADALITRGSVLVWVNRPEEGCALVRRGTDLAIEHDLPAIAWRGHNNLSWIEQLSDRLAASVANAELALQGARARGDRVWIRGVELLIASLRGEQGDWDAIEAAARVTDVGSSGSLTIDSEVFVSLVVALAGRGRRDEVDALAEVIAGGLETEDRQSREACQVAYALALADRGEREAALPLLRSLVTAAVTPHVHFAVLGVFEIARDLGREDILAEVIAEVRAMPAVRVTPTIRAHADRFAAHLAARAGGIEEAGRLLERSAAALAAAGRPFERAKVLLDHGELLAGGESDADGRALLADARSIFAGLGAEPWVRRTENALAAAAA